MLYHLTVSTRSKFIYLIDQHIYDQDGFNETYGDDEGFWAMLTSYESLWNELVRDESSSISKALTDDDRKFLACQEGAILHEDTQGFVHVEYFNTLHECKEAWQQLLKDLSPEEGEDDDAE